MIGSGFDSSQALKLLAIRHQIGRFITLNRQIHRKTTCSHKKRLGNDITFEKEENCLLRRIFLSLWEIVMDTSLYATIIYTLSLFGALRHYLLIENHPQSVTKWYLDALKSALPTSSIMFKFSPMIPGPFIYGILLGTD